jgi:sugar phosphate isomerase/epimerase
LDVGHAWGSGGIDAGIKIFDDLIKHVQVHDARGPEGAGNVRDQHLEIGTGLVKWNSVGEFVRGNEFIVVVETSGRDSDREGMALRSRDLLQKQWNS